MLMKSYSGQRLDDGSRSRDWFLGALDSSCERGKVRGKGRAKMIARRKIPRAVDAEVLLVGFSSSSKSNFDRFAAMEAAIDDAGAMGVLVAGTAGS